MEEVAENAPREHFEANALAQSCCLNCFHPEEAHSPRHQEPQSPLSAEVPYCDLPHRSPASEDLLGASTSGCQSAVGLGLGPGPERVVTHFRLIVQSVGHSLGIPPALSLLGSVATLTGFSKA
uniref:Uncharacterized protein n=1 Tax=Equus caballus TaxID=9796 RepID=A0A9L0TF39_HORSE